jgi:hypothetical protein
VQHVTEDDYRQPETKARIENFNNAIAEVCSDQNHTDAGIEGNMHQLDNYDELDEDVENVEPVDGEEFPGVDIEDHDADSLDTFIGAEVLLPHGDGQIRAKVTKRAKGADGKPIGRFNDNPILNTREYEVEFPDGSFAEYTAKKCYCGELVLAG